MPIRLADGLGSVREGKAFRWAVDHGADIISCSWGPQDGDWWTRTTEHNIRVPLSPSTVTRSTMR